MKNLIVGQSGGPTAVINSSLYGVIREGFNHLNPSWIHIGMNRTSGVAEFFTFKKTGKKQLENDAATLNMSIGDYLFMLLADPESNISDYLECGSNE